MVSEEIRGERHEDAARADRTRPDETQPDAGDFIDDVVEECILADDVDAAVASACRRHPDHADVIRRVVARLQEGGPLSLGASGMTAIPERLGDFRLTARLGEGGMGVVYRARDEVLERDVAVKVVRPDLVHFAGSRERFRREVEAVARLQHPGIVAVYRVGEADAVPYFGMEYVDGEPLSAVIARAAEQGTASDAGYQRRGIGLVREVALALQHAHERGVVHRDLKPSNILVDRAGRARVLDFGIARLEGAQQMTRASSVLGSLPYMPPEVLAGEVSESGPVQDIYSLGVTLYEVLTTRCPFLDGSRERTQTRIVSGDVKPPRREQPGISWEAETVCLTAMERDPGRRYASMAELARDLEAVLHRRPIRARRAGASLRVRRWVQRHPAGAVAVVFAFFLFAVVPMAFAIYQEGVARDALALQRVSDANGYEAGIGGAAANLRAGDEAAARRSLELCPENLRGWEWRYLSRELNRGTAVLTGHSDVVEEVAFVDRGRVASVSRDGTARLWNIQSGAQQALLQGHRGAVLSITSHGGRLVTGGVDGTVRAWTPGDPELRIAARYGQSVHQVRFAPDGSLLAVGTNDGGVHVLDGTSFEPVATLRSGDRTSRIPIPTFALAFDPETGALAATTRDSAVIWPDPRHPGSGSRQLAPPNPEIPLHEGWVYGLAFATDGSTLYTADLTGIICSWEIASGEVVKASRIGPGSIFSIAFDPVRSWLWCIGVVPLSVTDANLDFIDERRGHDGAGHAVAVSPDGAWVATAGADDTVRLWAAGERPRIWPQAGSVHALDLSADGARGFVAAGRAVALWDVERGRPIGRIEFDGQVDDLALHPDGGELLVAVDGELYRCEVDGSAEPERLDAGPDRVRGVVWHPDGSVFYTVTNRGTLGLWSRGARAPDRTVPPDAPSDPDRIRCSPDGRFLLTMGSGREVLLWDAGGSFLARLRGHTLEVKDAAFLPGTDRAITGGHDGRLLVWDLEQRTVVKELPSWSSQRVSSLAVSPDGTRLVVGAMQGMWQVREVESGKPLLAQQAHDGAVLDLTFTPDGQALLSASMDGSVRLFDTFSDASR